MRGERLKRWDGLGGPWTPPLSLLFSPPLPVHLFQHHHPDVVRLEAAHKVGALADEVRDGAHPKSGDRAHNHAEKGEHERAAAGDGGQAPPQQGGRHGGGDGGHADEGDDKGAHEDLAERGKGEGGVERMEGWMERASARHGGAGAQAQGRPPAPWLLLARLLGIPSLAPWAAGFARRAPPPCAGRPHTGRGGRGPLPQKSAPPMQSTQKKRTPKKSRNW
jgi:hypothetical protein